MFGVDTLSALHAACMLRLLSGVSHSFGIVKVGFVILIEKLPVGIILTARQGSAYYVNSLLIMGSSSKTNIAVEKMLI